MKGSAVRLVRQASTDAQALDRVAQGDVGVLGEVYDRHGRALLAFVSRVHDSSDAEDVVQEVFVRASRNAADYDGRTESARAWLFGIAARIIQERRRSLRRLSRALVRFGAHSSSSHHAEPQRLDIDKALRRMSEAKRVVLVLAEVEGFTCDEVANILSIPVGTVWTRLHHARKELRRFYEEDS